MGKFFACFLALLALAAGIEAAKLTTIHVDKANGYEIKFGIMAPMYKTIKNNVKRDSSGIMRFMAARMAINEINANNDILPGANIVFHFRDSQRDAGSAFFAAEDVAQWGANVAIGPASSGPTANAQLVLKVYNIPQSSFSATSPSLSDNDPASGTYPFYIGMPPSDAFQAVGQAEIIKKFGWKKVATFNDISTYGSGGMDVFLKESMGVIDILASVAFPKSKADFSEDLSKAILVKARVMVCIAQAGDAGRLIQQGHAAGLGGKGFTWIGSDSVMKPDVWETMDFPAGTSDADIKAGQSASLKGLVGLTPSADRTLPEYLSLLSKWQAQAPTCTPKAGMEDTHTSCDDTASTESCDQATDETGFKIFDRIRDDGSPGCAGIYDYVASGLNSYAPYSYDIAYMWSKTIHQLVEAGETTISGTMIRDAAREIQFDGASGKVGFKGGARAYGIRYILQNFDSATHNMRDWGYFISGATPPLQHASDVQIEWSTGMGGVSDAPPDASSDDCVVGEGWDAANSRCAVCVENTYNLDGAGECKDCPDGATCGGGYQVSVLKDHWWDPSTAGDAKVYRCRPNWCCDDKTCALSVESANNTLCTALDAPAGDTQDACSRVQCAENKVGRLCGKCKEGSTLVDDECLDSCDSESPDAFVVLVVFALIVVSALLSVNHGNSCWGYNLIPEGMVKVLANYFNLLQLFQFDSISFVSKFFSLNAGTAVDITGKCLLKASPLANSLLSAIWPFIAMACVGFLCLVEGVLRAVGVELDNIGLVQTWRQRVRPASRRLSRFGILGEKSWSDLGLTKMPWYYKYMFVFTQMALFSHAVIAIVSLRLFQCRKVAGVDVLSMSPSVTCYEGDHSTFFTLAIVFLCVYVLPLPIIAFFLVRNMVKEGYTPNTDATRFKEKKFGVLFVGYKPSFWWYETFNVSRRILIIGLVIALDVPEIREQQDSLVSMAFMSIFVMLLAALHFATRPFLHDIDNFMEGMFLIALSILPMVDYARITCSAEDTDAFNAIESVVAYFPVGLAVLCYLYRGIRVKGVRGTKVAEEMDSLKPQEFNDKPLALLSEYRL